MADIKWIKIDTGLFNNRKIKMIERMEHGDTLIVIWLKMMILAAETNDNGYLMFTDDTPYDAELMAVQFNKSVKSIEAALDLFVKYDMLDVTIDKTGTIYSISNWDKYQNIDGMDRIRELNRLRKQRERDRKRDAECDSHATSRDSHGADKEEDKDKIKNNNKRALPFKPPTVDEVKDYCLERNNGIDPQAFIDFYESKGWIIGSSGKMKDWKAAVRTWENRRKTENKPKKTQMHDFKENQYDFNDLERKIEESQRAADRRYKC